MSDPSQPWLSLCQNWEILASLQGSVSPAFRRDGLLPLAAGASPQVRAAAFDALLCSEPWPGLCEWFRRVACEPYRALVCDECADYPLGFSVAPIIAEDLILITIRNAAIWYRRRRQSTNGSWEGFLRRHIRSLIRRLVAKSDVIWTGSGGLAPGLLLESGIPTGQLPGSRYSLDELLAVRSAIRRLSPNQQRVVRLMLPWWPARKKWHPAKVALYLQIPDAEVHREHGAALAAIRFMLQDHFPDWGNL